MKKKKMMENQGFSNFTYVIVTVNFTTFVSLIIYRNTRRSCYVGLTADAFESSELLHLLRLNGRVGAIPT